MKITGSLFLVFCAFHVFDDSFQGITLRYIVEGLLFHFRLRTAILQRSIDVNDRLSRAMDLSGSF